MARTALLLTDQSYVRKERGIIKAQVSADRIYDCSYLMYRNTSYGNKWFYAFITGVEYDNDLTSIISFQIDDIQTWFFEYDTPPCLVERCHSYSDSIGDNIVPEPVDPGDLIPNDYHALHAESDPLGFMDRNVLLVSFVDPEDDNSKGKLINGIFTTGVLYLFEMTDQGISDAAAWIADVSEQYFDSIISMYMVPKWAIGPYFNPYWLPNSQKGMVYDRNLTKVTPGQKIDGYTPKNNKLYTYPYNCLSVYTAAGDTMQVRYEFFKNLTPTFEETWVVLEPVSAVLRPTNYRNITVSNKDISLTMSDFPMAMWSGDAYKAYLAQNKVSRTSSILQIIGGLATAAMTGGLSLLATAQGLSNLVDSDYKASIAADQRGGQASGNNAWSHGQMDYYASRMTCTYDKAVMIDSYFTAFGYAQGKVMRPPRHNRRSFTYVKTDGCIVKGPLPSEAGARIKAAYDSGIRFWANHTSFGNLAIDNYTL